MITNDEQLNQAVKSLGRMCRAMAALRAEVLPVNARRFALMAEGPVDEIRRLQAQIDAYAGREAAEENDADVWLRLYGRDSEGLCRVHGMSLLSNPVNAEHLRQSIAEAKAGKTLERELIDP